MACKLRHHRRTRVDSRDLVARLPERNGQHSSACAEVNDRRRRLNQDLDLLHRVIGQPPIERSKLFRIEALLRSLLPVKPDSSSLGPTRRALLHAAARPGSYGV
jgi:hypothetical protein